jgi:PAS domain-containing protein
VATVQRSAPPAADPAPEPDSEDALRQWVAAARCSLDACLVVDAGGTVAGLSPVAAELLGAAPGTLIGRSLDEVLNLVDFSDSAQEATGVARRIPPLIAVRENSLSRGMMRVRLPGGERLMLDAVAAPIHDVERKPIGSVSFLASV